MNQAFKKVGIMGKRHVEKVKETLLALIAYLDSDYELFLDNLTADATPDAAKLVSADHIVPKVELGKHVDIIIVIGGDGKLLKAAHVAVLHDTPILGINRGRLGFLADIKPDAFDKISTILQGDYIEDPRTLLHMHIQTGITQSAQGLALNDAVLLPGNLPHMVEYEIYIGDKFVCSQRADGLIVATATGSTAYSLSGGGPVLHPALNTFVIVPMFPHTLTSRPIIVDGDSEIRICLAESNKARPAMSCDGLDQIPVLPGDTIHLKKHAQSLRLIHPSDYDYYQNLRSKLGWGRKL